MWNLRLCKELFLPLTPRINILGDLLESLQKHAGYQEGNWDNPAPDGDRDTFYTFVYDWRRDNVQIAQQLIERISLLKSKLNKPELRFNDVAISMGGLDDNQRPLPIVQAFFACGGHGGLHNNRTLQDNALSVLVRRVVK